MTTMPETFLMIIKEVSFTMETFIKPPLYVSSDLIFNSILVIATVFSALFYILAIHGIVSKPKVYRYKETNGKKPFITVQIPTYNEVVALRCAEKCLKFDYPGNRYEILIGDDSNKSEVSDIIDEFARKHRGRVRVIRRPTNKGYKAGNLNNMLKYSRGEILVIFDSDFVPSRDFLKRIIQPFSESKKVAAVQSRWEFLNADQSIVSRLYSSILIVYHHLTLPLINRFGVSFICGSAEAVRKDVLLKLGGWQNGSLTEDTEFSIRIMEMGYRSVYLQDLVTPGEAPFTLNGFKRQQMRWAYGTIRAFMDHKKKIFFNKYFNNKQRIMLSFVLLGYLISPVLAMLLVSGTMAFLTNTPGPIDVIQFSTSLGRNILLTSGFIAASLVALKKNRRLLMFPKLLVSSFTAGIIISFSVSLAIFKSIIKRPMDWYMIKKSGNQSYLLLQGPQIIPVANKYTQ